MLIRALSRATRAPGRVCPDETHYCLAHSWRGEYEARAARPDTETVPVLRGRAQIVQTGTFAVQCADCGAMGPPAPNMERAAVRWNKRKGDDFGW